VERFFFANGFGFSPLATVERVCIDLTMDVCNRWMLLGGDGSGS
jgi:hypothetical protein